MIQVSGGFLSLQAPAPPFPFNQLSPKDYYLHLLTTFPPQKKDLVTPAFPTESLVSIGPVRRVGRVTQVLLTRFGVQMCLQQALAGKPGKPGNEAPGGATNRTKTKRPFLNPYFEHSLEVNRKIRSDESLIAD